MLEDASAAEFGGGATNTPYSTSSAMLRACACWALGELSRAEGLPEEATHAALLRAMTDPRLAEAPAARSAAASAIAAALRRRAGRRIGRRFSPRRRAAAGPGPTRFLRRTARATPRATPAATRTRTRRGSARRGSSPSPPRRRREVRRPGGGGAAVRRARRRGVEPHARAARAAPPLVETALEALVAVLDAAGEAADERRGDVVGSDAADLPPDPSLVALVPHACASLRRAWLPAAWGLDAWASPRGAACAGDSHMLEDGLGVQGGFGDEDDDAGAAGPPAACCMGDASRILAFALLNCPDALSGNQVSLGALVAAHAALLGEWDAWEEEEEEAAFFCVAEASRAVKRGALIVQDPALLAPLIDAHASFCASAMENAAALGAARARARRRDARPRRERRRRRLASPSRGEDRLRRRARTPRIPRRRRRRRRAAPRATARVRRRRRVARATSARGGSLGLTPNAVLGWARAAAGRSRRTPRGQRVPGRDERVGGEASRRRRARRPRRRRRGPRGEGRRRGVRAEGRRRAEGSARERDERRGGGGR